MSSKARTKVNSLWRIPRFVIALHSRNALLETGLLMCASEKNWDSDGLRCRAVHYLQSGLWTKYCGIQACFSYFGGESGGISLQLRLAGGARSLALTLLRPKFPANREKYREFAKFCSQNCTLLSLTRTFCWRKQRVCLKS